MKTSIESLPKERQDELRKIADTGVQLVNPEKIILFGSYATGRQVADKYVSGHVTYEYLSDYDILVVTSRGEKREEHQIQEMLETKCQSLTIIPVNIIVHGIDYVNKRISEGQYFFTDIKKEGILLYDAGNIPLVEQKKLSSQEKRTIIQNNFDYWYSNAVKFLKGVMLYYNDKDLNMGAFMLHQAAERTYNTIILVFTGYKPKTHNLGKLMRMSREFSPELISIFPNNSPEKYTYLHC